LTVALLLLSIVLLLLWVYFQKTEKEVERRGEAVKAPKAKEKHRGHKHIHRPVKRHPRKEVRRGKVRGRVLKPDGSPCSGAEVEVVSIGHNWSGVARTDRDGYFYIDGVPPGKLFIVADLKEHPRAYSRNLWLPPGGEVTDTLSIARSITLVGKVLTKKTNLPIGNAEVTVRKVHLSEPDAVVTTDASGDFTIKGLSRGEYYIEVSADGYVQEEKIPVSWILKDAVTNICIFMEPAARITGKVRDEKGRPVSGAVVSFKRTSTRTGKDGSYALNVKAETADLIVAHKDFALEVVELLEVVEGDWRIVNITLKKGCLLKGRVTSNGKPVSGARVKLIRYWRGFGAMYVYERAITDDNGEYSFHITPGTHYLEVKAAGFGLNHRMLEIPEGLTECVQNFDLVESAVIAGSVVDSSGRGLEGVLVELFGGPAPISAVVKTEEDGSFIIKDVPDAVYTLVFSKDGYVMEKRKSIRPDTTGIKVRLIACGSVEGIVSFDGTPQAGVAVIAWARPDLKFRTLTDEQGNYRIAGLEPGDYTVVAETRGYSSGEYHIRVGEKTTTKLDIVLEKK